MPGSRTTLPHTYLTLLLTAPLSCHPDDQPGQVSDPHGCRTIILPNDPTTTSSSSTTDPETSSTATTAISTSTPTDPTDATTTQTSSSTTGPTPTCGDGNIDDSEQCDDGPVMNGPGMSCLANCTANTCGDGDQGPDEECDNGPDNADDAACTSTCTLAKCGDSLTQKDIEDCDDGNNDPNDGCSADCYIERIVFVSNKSFIGNSGPDGLKGLAGADTICQTLAGNSMSIPKGKMFKAWLSVDGMNPESPSTRFPEAVTTAKGRFLLPNNTVIANNWADLTDGTLSHAIDIDEHGMSVTESTVWTNTKPDGTPATKGDCSAWTNSANMAKAGIGYTLYTDTDWSDNLVPNACANSARIYCFQVTP